MPTDTEKLAELRRMLGDADGKVVDEVIAAADRTQKSADDEGVEWKEHNTEKAKKTPPKKSEAKPPVEEDVDEEEAELTEDMEDLEAEDLEAEEDEAEEDEEKEDNEEDEEEEDEEEEDEEEEDEKEYQTVGDLSMDDFADVVAGALSVALEPYTKAVKEAHEALEKLAGEVQTIKEAGGRRLKEARNFTTRIKELESRLTELESEVPNALRDGYRASEDAGTVVKEDSPLRDSMPKPDPLGDFMQFINPR